MPVLRRLFALLSDLRLAILLLLLIAGASALGTILPQNEAPDLYLERFNADPWLGLINGEQMLQLQLDSIYSSVWFLSLLAWLGLALILCSWRRQWPALLATTRWIDYRQPRQLSKLALAESIHCSDGESALDMLSSQLQKQGWQVQRHEDRLAARRGVIGKVGPLLVHTGLVLLMIGAAWGALSGNRLERFLAPGRALDLLDPSGNNRLSLTLERFAIERDPAGRTEQFRSTLRLDPPGGPSEQRMISVNHPLRYRGMTVYQADWSLAAITVQIGKSPQLQLPLRSFPELGEQIWGLVLPTRPDGSEPVLMSTSSEQGPVQVFDADGSLLGNLRPGGASAEIKGLPLRVAEIMPASGLLLKRDPGVPLVYAGFAITLLGGGLSLIATRQLWAVLDPPPFKPSNRKLHIGGLCNRNLAGLAAELPILISRVDGSRD